MKIFIFLAFQLLFTFLVFPCTFNWSSTTEHTPYVYPLLTIIYLAITLHYKCISFPMQTGTVINNITVH